jgi:sugar (pentulose or hexulose) kinase
MTSIGCHTMLWDFRKNDYHTWVKAEGIVDKFPPIRPSASVVPVAIGTDNQVCQVGIGLHDSSAALIPYLACFDEPFVLISTGTWCITLNPFNHEPLTPDELARDCLCYLTFEGKPVKAARYFGGNEHELMVKSLAAEFGVAEDFYQVTSLAPPALAEKYSAFMRQLIEKQVQSTRLAMGQTHVQRLFVDGGFSKNEIYMDLLAAAFPQMKVYAAEAAQATALGAALAIHGAWNEKVVSGDLIGLKRYGG